MSKLPTEYKINGLTYEIKRNDDNAITDILVTLPSVGYTKLLNRLPDPNATAQTAPYLYLFNNALNEYNAYAALELAKLKAEYESIADKNPDEAKKLVLKADKIQQMKALMQNLREFAAPFAELEKFINDPGYDPSNKLLSFNQALSDFRARIDLRVEDLQKNYAKNENIKNLLEKRFFPRINEKLEAFEKQEIFELENPTSQQVRHLLSINRRSASIEPLGVLIGECLIETLDMGLKAAKDILDQRLLEQIGALHGPDELTRAKLQMEIKLSTEGAGFVDSHGKTDETLISTFMTQPVIVPSSYDLTFDPENDPLNVPTYPVSGTDIPEFKDKTQYPKSLRIKPENPKTISLLYYCPKLKTRELVKIIDLIETVRKKTNNDLKSKDGHRRKITSLAIASWIFVVGALEATFAVTHAAFNLCVLLPLSVFDDGLMETIDRGLSKAHDSFSKKFGIKRALSKWNESYLFGKKEQLKDFVNGVAKEHDLFQEVGENSLSLNSIKNLFRSCGEALYNILVRSPYQFIRYAIIERNRSTQQTFDEVNQEYDNNINAILFLEKITEMASGNFHPKLNKPNNLQIPTTFVTDLVVGGSNLLVTPVFRNAPGVAASFFAISIAGFVCFLPPVAAIACLKSISAALKAPLNAVGVELLGAPPTNIMNQAVSALFLWKAGVLTTEVMVSMYKGHYDFLSSLIEEPEKLILGLVSIVAIGEMLKYLPPIPTNIILPDGTKIPNLYAQIINFYIEQAHTCSPTAHLAEINYMLLGIQTAVLLQTIAKVDKRDYPMVKLLESFKTKDIFGNQSEEKKLLLLKEAFAECDIDIIDKDIDSLISEIPKIKLASINILQTPLAPSSTVASQNIPENSSHQTTSDRKKLSELNFKETHKQIIELSERLEHHLRFHDNEKSSARNEAMRYFEHIDALIDRYNELAIEKNVPLIDKGPLEAVFYRRYCTTTKTMIERFMIIGLYPLIVLGRATSALYGFVMNKKSWIRSAKIATADDIIMVSHLVFGFVRAVWAFALYVSGVARMPLAPFILIARTADSISNQSDSNQSDSNQSDFNQSDSNQSDFNAVNTDDYVFNDDYTPPKDKKPNRTITDRLYEAANSISLHRAYNYAKRTPIIGPIVSFIGGGIASIHTNAAHILTTNDDVAAAAKLLREHLVKVGKDKPLTHETSTYARAKALLGDRVESETTHTPNDNLSTQAVIGNNDCLQKINDSQSIDQKKTVNDYDKGPSL